MNDGVAVGAHWQQVSNRVDKVIRAESRKEPKMVHVNKILANATICGGKAKLTDAAGHSVMRKAGRSRSLVAFVPIHQDALHGPFGESGALRNFLGRPDRPACCAVYGLRHAVTVAAPFGILLAWEVMQPTFEVSRLRFSVGGGDTRFQWGTPPI